MNPGKSESYPTGSHYEQLGFYSLDRTWEFSFHGYRGSVWEDEKSSREMINTERNENSQEKILIIIVLLIQ